MGKYLRILLIQCICLIFVYPSLAQNEEQKTNPRNTIYVELFGNAYLYSLNYKRVLLDKETYSLSARAGISYIQFHLYENSNSFRFLPVSVNFIKHFNHHNLEIGLGASYLYYTSSNYGGIESIYEFIPTFHVNYRRFNEDNWELRIGLNFARAFLSEYEGYRISPWPILSIGKRF